MQGGADRYWYYGCKLLLSVTVEGVATGFYAHARRYRSPWLAGPFSVCVAARWEAPLEVADMPLSPGRQSLCGIYRPVWPICDVGVASATPYLSDNGFFGILW